MQSLLEQPDRLERRLKEILTEPGCYLMRDAEDRLLYVGKSASLRSRVRSYRSRHDLSPRIRLMVSDLEIEFIVTDSEAEALALEANLIKNQQPHHRAAERRQKISLSLHHLERGISKDLHHPAPTVRSPLDRFYGPYVDVGFAAHLVPCSECFPR